MNRFDLHALNADIRSGAEDFIARCDRRYDRLVAETAEQIAGNLPNSPIILLAGPSGSGKTTTALRIRAALEAKGIGSHSISLDDYYRSPAEPDYPTAETGEPDLESPLGLDVPLLTQHLTDLAAGREIQVPHFNFKIHDRDPGGSRPLRLGSGEVVVFEGLHALNPMFTERHPHAFRIYVSTATDLYDGGELLLPPRSLPSAAPLRPRPVPPQRAGAGDADALAQRLPRGTAVYHALPAAGRRAAEHGPRL